MEKKNPEMNENNASQCLTYINMLQHIVTDPNNSLLAVLSLFFDWIFKVMASYVVPYSIQSLFA